ncbi:MAG: CDP-diacylglycerol--serine O-phosphatidyltransferase [Deltaproteobacteria bacterium]|nr:CDP-diacylglycerol--serine O-phosphatidyltransferase [Deltaproteobacteria bacterium]
MNYMKKKKGKPMKGMYLLPNFLTSLSLLSGFYAIIASMDRRFTYAAIAIFISAIFDMLDGRVARMTNSSSRFGVEYDSLSDVIAFGVAPAVLAYMWALKSYGKFGWLAAFLFVACGALRLARFNIQVDTVQKKHFLGLPIPAGAATIAGIVLFYSWMGYMGGLKTIIMPIVIYCLALLMVSKFRYISFKDMGFVRARPFMSTVGVIIGLVIVLTEYQVSLFVATSAYAISGPIYTLILHFKKEPVEDAIRPRDNQAGPGGR